MSATEKDWRRLQPEVRNEKICPKEVELQEDREDPVVGAKIELVAVEFAAKLLVEEVPTLVELDSHFIKHRTADCMEAQSKRQIQGPNLLDKRHQVVLPQSINDPKRELPTDNIKILKLVSKIKIHRQTKPNSQLTINTTNHRKLIASLYRTKIKVPKTNLW